MHENAEADREKKWIALTSVIAAVFLTSAKLVIGVLTGSLGILSEAAHSGLDLIAAVVTYFAVRTSGKPADEEHHYGHEKIENLSALIETQLLLITCIWIIYEALRRLLFTEVEVDVTPWAFGVVIFSIIVDISRSRALLRVAKKYNSQALEADALHFSTDIYSSLVVLVGLTLVYIGEKTGTAHILVKADPVAALSVAGIVIWVSLQLGKRSVNALLDSAPEGLSALIENAVRRIEGVRDCRNLRLRQSGSRTFVDLTIDVDRSLSIQASNLIARLVEREIRAILPAVDVMVRTDPSEPMQQTLNSRIRADAEAAGHKVHNIFVYQQDNTVFAELHLEVPEKEPLLKAHEASMRLEELLLKDIPALKKVDIHIEPRREHYVELHDVTAASGPMEDLAKEALLSIPGITACHEIVVRESPDGLYLAMHVIFPNEMPLENVHRKLSEAESKLFRVIPDLKRVLMHPEPSAFANH